LKVRNLLSKKKSSNTLKNIISELVKKLKNTTTDNVKEVDEELSRLVADGTDVETLVDEYEEILNTARRKVFNTYKSSQRNNGGKSLTWWTQYLTIRRKKTNALRRRYQRTINNEELREKRRRQYLKEKKEYNAINRKEKLQSRKEYCSRTPSNNPCNAVYRLASGNIRNTPLMTTLKKQDNTTTTDGAGHPRCKEHLKN
jgi:paraquat-inducible protein B